MQEPRKAKLFWSRKPKGFLGMQSISAQAENRRFSSMKKRKFLRRDWQKRIKLRNRRKKLKWRRPKGRDNQMRLKRKGYAPVVSIGYGTKKSTRNLIHGKKPVIIYNLNELLAVQADKMPILSATLGAKKKIEIARKAIEKKIKILNFNPEKFLADIEKNKEDKKKAEEDEKKKKEKQAAKEKKVKEEKKKTEVKEEKKEEPENKGEESK